MNELESRYFEWLLFNLNPDGVRESVAHLGGLLHNCIFRRRVGKDNNRAVNGALMRQQFFMQNDTDDFDPEDMEEFLLPECTWFEMLVAFSIQLDFMYDGGVEGRFLELIDNMQLSPLLTFNPRRTERTREFDQRFVDKVTSDIDNNNFDPDGFGGLFPLRRPKSDQRKVEIWDQHSAYFMERAEGVWWTSTR